jgi:hypothetical protein
VVTWVARATLAIQIATERDEARILAIRYGSATFAAMAIKQWRMDKTIEQIHREADIIRARMEGDA